MVVSNILCALFYISMPNRLDCANEAFHCLYFFLRKIEYAFMGIFRHSFRYCTVNHLGQANREHALHGTNNGLLYHFFNFFF